MPAHTPAEMEDMYTLQIFNNTVFDKIIRYCKINAQLMPKLTVTAKLENAMPNATHTAKKCQTAKLKFLLPSYFKMPNLTYLALFNASWQPGLEKKNNARFGYNLRHILITHYIASGKNKWRCQCRPVLTYYSAIGRQPSNPDPNHNLTF